MAGEGATFRVFISSTFSDLHAERDVLRLHVFEPLQAYCQERGARFQAIDLRWGVSDDAFHNQQAMAMCLRRSNETP